MQSHQRIAAVACVLMLLSVAATHADDRPNIVLVMVDDMGYSDLGCYGSEIDTPNLDQLASDGLRFTQFYNCAKCETTRASLLSGRYHPEVGIAKLENCVTIAEVLRSAGYNTLMTGKWHLSKNPVDRGWERYFGHLSGSTNFFRGDDTFRLDKERFDVPREGFYTTDANTDYAIEFLKETPTDKPFFLYIAHNAPHYPLQCPQEEFEKYRGQYQIGWDELRQRRHAKMIEMGIVSKDWPLVPRPDDVPAWDSLSDEQKDRQDLTMAAFAGMIDRVDQNMGRLFDHLREIDRLDNTLILFLSDNGGCPFQRTHQKTLEQNLMPWDPESYWTYDKGWAHACNTPFREYKRDQHEGGIATPLIAHWPTGISDSGRLTHQPGHIVDIMATCIDLAAADYPSTFAGKPVGPARGLSLRPIFSGEQRPPHEELFHTFYGQHNALRMGDWKLVNKDGQKFELYNLSTDRTELNDLADEIPERFSAMKARWQELADEMGVKPRAPKRKKQQ